MRLFVAAWPDEELRAELAGRLAALRHAVPWQAEASVRWVLPENLHVTLHFLGDVDPGRAPELVERLGRALRDAPDFPVRLAAFGAFPPRGSPRVIWVGMDTGAAELEALASRTESVLVDGGFLEPSERPFRAHVTLGRSKGPRGLERLLPRLAEPSPLGGAHRLTEVRLVESRLDPRGAKYVPVARFPLRGSP